MPMTLVELMRRISEKRTAGFHCSAELTLTYGAPAQPEGPKEWRPIQPNGHWTLRTGLSLQYAPLGGGARKPLPTFQGSNIRPLLEAMVEFFNSAPMRIYTPANSYGIDGFYELTDRIELGEISF